MTNQTKLNTSDLIIGFTWASSLGTKTIVDIGFNPADKDTPLYLFSFIYENELMYRNHDAPTLLLVIEKDTHKLTDEYKLELYEKSVIKKEQQAIEEKRDLRDKEILQNCKLYLDSLSPRPHNLICSKIIAALTKKVSNNGKILSRQELIMIKVNSGYIVNDKERLINDENVFLDKDALTLTGIRYAKFLTL